MGRIGYRHLSAEEQKIYTKLEAAFDRYSPTVDVSGTPRNIDLIKILNVVLGDRPDVIYFDKNKPITTTRTLGSMQLKFNDVISASRAKAMQQKLHEDLDNAVREIELLNPMTDFDKLMCIYEYLQDRLTYNKKELERLSRGLPSNAEAHNAYGTLRNNTGVCDGIASAFALLAEKMGFECCVVTGQSLNEFTTSAIQHAWNIVRIGNRYFHCDLTWDICGKMTMGCYYYTYLCVDDTTLGSDHDWDVRYTPACNSSEFSFYKKNQCVANNLSHLDAILLRYAKSKQTVVRVKIAEGIPVPYPQQDFMLQKMMDAAATANRYGQLHGSWNDNARCFTCVLS